MFSYLIPDCREKYNFHNIAINIQRVTRVSMSLGIIGQKCGMTRIFTENGNSIPVTVIHAEPNTVIQLKTIDTDGYNSIQVTTGIKKRSHVNKAEAGHFSKANAIPGHGLWEFRLDEEQLLHYRAGTTFNVSIFTPGQKVDVVGRCKGKGFQGGVKRHNFKTQDMSHGNSLSHRAHGSTGQNQTPGRVFKNKKMAGHMGNSQTTVQSLEVIKVNDKDNLLLLKGSIPGAVNSNVIVMPAIKFKNLKRDT